MTPALAEQHGDATSARLPSLPSEVTIYNAAELRAQWLACLDALPERPDDTTGLHTTLDASRIDVVDGAGVQLLLALARSLQRRGRILRLARPTEALRVACATLGTEHLLDGAAA